jgi:hypothetical protein
MRRKETIMPSTRKFQYTEILVQIVSEGPLAPYADLSDIDYLIAVGDASEKIIIQKEETIDGPKAAEILLEQDSDPELFQLDTEGNDL